MDAVVKAPCDVEIFRKNSLVMIHCLDLNARFELSVKSFPILQLKCIYGHISFMTDLSERRVVVFPDSEVVLSKLKDIKSPCCLEVKSSAIFEVRHCFSYLVLTPSGLLLRCLLLPIFKHRWKHFSRPTFHIYVEGCC